jgi:hypothetical protein
MKTNISLVIALVIVALATPSNATQPTANSSDAYKTVAAQNLALGSDLLLSKKKPTLSDLKVAKTVGAPVAAPPNSSGNGPWVVRVVLRTSTDGIAFSGGETLMDQAGVPNLLVTSNGDTYAYYQDWANGNVMGVAIQRAGSKTWTRYKLHVSGFNIAPGGANGVDPSAIELPNGQIRVFWMQGSTSIYSATSEKGSGNGVIFKFDGKTALNGYTGRVFDPTVVRTNSGWAMWVDSEGTPIYATSKDGKSFTAQTGNPLFTNAKTFPWGAVRLKNGEIRILASIQGPGGADGVILKSTDGGQSFVEVTRGTIPTGSGGDAGISFNPKTKLWLQLLGERMN